MTALDDKLAKGLAENPESMHGLIRKSIEQERLFEMLARATFDATEGAADWEGGGSPDWEQIKGHEAPGYDAMELDVRHKAQDFWALCNLLGIPEDQVLQKLVAYYEANGIERP